MNISKRIKILKDNLLNPTREISLERATLYTESYKQTAGMPSVLRRAHATKHILENVEIKIDSYELIVGDRTIRPRSGITSPEMSPYWILEEMDTMYSRPQDKFIFNEEDKVKFKEELFPYWDGKSLKNYVDEKMSDDVKTSIKDGIVKINQTDKGQGHIIPNFSKVLYNGIDAIIDEAKSSLNKDQSNDFLKAAVITLEALQSYIIRYANLAEELYVNEKDEMRKSELATIRDICQKVAHEKPHSFYEALQLFWLVNLALQFESNASSISSGRFDQYMISFYRQSLADGVDEAFCRELLRCLWLKMNDVVLLRSEDSAKYFAGFPTGYTIILGGVDANGRDATNELSYIVLETFGDIRLPQPNLGVRIHEKSPIEFMMKSAETIRLGTGIPQIFNDEVIIPGYLNRGVSLEDARDYAVVGCVELSLPGKTYGLHDIALFNLLKVLEVTLDRHIDTIDSFDQLIEEIKKTIREYVVYMVEGSNICDEAHGELAPTPLLSCFIDDCIMNGSDVCTGGAVYNFSGVQGIGIGNLSDSLYVIKKAVFEDQSISLKELQSILKEDYADNEILRQRFINKYDKYGNDIDEVDYLGSDILSFYCMEVEKYDNVRGGVFQPGSYTVSAHIPLGESVGATPDGRHSKEQLADGGLSPMVGRDKNGPTSVLKSVSKLDNYLTTNGSLLNVKFSPSVLEGESGLRKFVNYLKAFMRLKIQHIQFNIVSADTLREAQKNPHNYKDLVIRVAGYSAIFVELNEAIQNDIISRTEHGI